MILFDNFFRRAVISIKFSSKIKTANNIKKSDEALTERNQQRADLYFLFSQYERFL